MIIKIWQYRNFLIKKPLKYLGNYIRFKSKENATFMKLLFLEIIIEYNIFLEIRKIP